MVKSKKAVDGYGNTVEHAAKMLLDHWDREHDGIPGDSLRPIECINCRNLADRVSAAVYREPKNQMTIHAVMMSYADVVQRVKTMEASGVLG